MFGHLSEDVPLDQHLERREEERREGGEERRWRGEERKGEKERDGNTMC